MLVMARKTAQDLKPKQLSLPTTKLPAREIVKGSWACIGVDTSMTACSVVAMGWDSVLKRTVGPSHGEIRWMPEDDYFKRLGEAAKGHELLLDCLRDMYVDLSRVFIAIEEPFPMGMLNKLGKGQSGWVKQQCEVAGAFKGSLVRYGFQNIYEINNSQWAKTLRDEGVPLLPPNRKDEMRKWKVKEWAIRAFGLPELPDLVKSKSGGKIPRPTEGYGANAKAVQPNDIYDAAAVCAWMLDEAERLGLVDI
jgi:hypothetical protein